jgi:hypothetical protein
LKIRDRTVLWIPLLKLDFQELVYPDTHRHASLEAPFAVEVILPIVAEELQHQRSMLDASSDFQSLFSAPKSLTS